MLHISWDQGAVNKALEQATGLVVLQQTTRTLCGKRVRMASINNDNPTCKECEHVWITEAVSTEEVLTELGYDLRDLITEGRREQLANARQG